MEETSSKEIASIEKFIKDLLNKYPDNIIDLTPERSVLIKSTAKILSPSDKVWPSQTRFTYRSLTPREINSRLGEWRRGNRFHTIQEINSQRSEYCYFLTFLFA